MTTKRSAVIALPEWREASPGGWTCDDPAEVGFYLRCTCPPLGFDLVKFDRWLATLEDCPTRKAMFEARAGAKAAGDPKAMLPHIQLMWTTKTWHDREDVLVPIADKGERFSKGKPPGAVSAATRFLRDQRRQGESARDLWARLKYDTWAETPVYFDGDELYETATERKISFKAFQKRLGTRKP